VHAEAARGVGERAARSKGPGKSSTHECGWVVSTEKISEKLKGTHTTSAGRACDVADVETSEERKMRGVSTTFSEREPLPHRRIDGQG